MKRSTLLFLLAMLLIATVAEAATPKRKDLSGDIAVRGTLKKEYNMIPAGTAVVVRRVVKLPGGTDESGIYYAIEANGVQHRLPVEELPLLAFSTPATDREFWQQVYLQNHLYEQAANRDKRTSLRHEIDEECQEYLSKLQDIAYQDDYVTAYVQNIFAKLNSCDIAAERIESLNVRLIQSPQPDAFMLPNGSMVISTGLLCLLDSEDELAAIIASELGHFVLDHQVENIYRAERRAKRAAFWAEVFASVSETMLDIAYWDDNEQAFTASMVADIGTIAALLSIPATDRLGMKYKNGQEIDSDRIALDLLRFKGYNPDGLASALGKLANHYFVHGQTEGLTRYNSVATLEKRIEKAGKGEYLSDNRFIKAMSEVVRFNATMNYANQQYKEAMRMAEKNIGNQLATDHDYLLLVQSRMALTDSEENNKECIGLLDKAQDLAGDSPNLDICKQRILLLLRMQEQHKAAQELDSYTELLQRYQSQEISEEEKEWTRQESNWARQMQRKLRQI